MVVDLARVEHARLRLERALELIRTIETAGRELEELVAGDTGALADLGIKPTTGDGQAETVAVDAPTAAGERVLRLVPGDEDGVRPAEHDAPAPPAPADPPVEASQTSAPAPATPPDSTPAAATPPSSEPAAAGSSSDPRAAANTAAGRRRREANIELVRGALRRLGPGWHGAGQVAGEAGVSSHTATACLRELAAADELDHNGKGGAWSKYRLPLNVDAPEQGPSPTAPAPAQPPPAPAPAPRPPDPPPPPPAAGPIARRPALDAPTVSRRVRRELDRDNSHGQAARADQALGVLNAGGTMGGRILLALQAKPAGVIELGKRLDTPVDELERMLNRMVATGDVLRRRNPRHGVGLERDLYEVCP